MSKSFFQLQVHAYNIEVDEPMVSFNIRKLLTFPRGLPVGTATYYCWGQNHLSFGSMLQVHPSFIFRFEVPWCLCFFVHVWPCFPELLLLVLHRPFVGQTSTIKVSSYLHFPWVQPSACLSLLTTLAHFVGSWESVTKTLNSLWHYG